ncbi:hypothetical protein B0H13DRAFT_1882205 [Mycena leptocephala]|nr:hypothetical protein B0H13DRAFT_1882205 [Mycena leptocephala]
MSEPWLNVKDGYHQENNRYIHPDCKKIKGGRSNSVERVEPDPTLIKIEKETGRGPYMKSDIGKHALAVQNLDVKRKQRLDPSVAEPVGKNPRPPETYLYAPRRVQSQVHANEM